MNNLYGNYRNRTFADIFADEEAFLADYKDSKLCASNNKITDDSVKTLFYLLYSEYGNSTISSFDETQFKYQIFSTIYEYGPTWERRIALQNSLRNLTEEQIVAGGVIKYKHAYNPETAPSTSDISYVNEQTWNEKTRTKLAGYAGLAELLDTDVTKKFISKFKRFFLQIVYPELPLWYKTIVEEGEEE